MTSARRSIRSASGPQRCAPCRSRITACGGSNRGCRSPIRCRPARRSCIARWTQTAAGLGADGPAWKRLMAPFERAGLPLVDGLLSPLSVPRHPVAMARFGLTGLRGATARRPPVRGRPGRGPLRRSRRPLDPASRPSADDGVRGHAGCLRAPRRLAVRRRRLAGDHRRAGRDPRRARRGGGV